jgi:hypothetical protein
MVDLPGEDMLCGYARQTKKFLAAVAYGKILNVTSKMKEISH